MARLSWRLGWCDGEEGGVSKWQRRLAVRRVFNEALKSGSAGGRVTLTASARKRSEENPLSQTQGTRGLCLNLVFYTLKQLFYSSVQINNRSKLFYTYKNFFIKKIVIL